MNNDVYSRLAAIDVQDEQGRTVRLADRMEGQLTILVFIRHFG